MSPDLTGVNGVGRPPGLPTASTRPVDPSRALAPVGPVSPRTPPAADTLLGRSGVGVGDVLLTADVLEQREMVAPVALEMGLEEARASLLRRLPGDALAALDAVWSTARMSEEGWYLRSGALTVMGLPGEGDRIAAEGLQRQPTSLALRLVQSVARVLIGDISGARSALAPALDEAPREPVLVAQQAVILARQGYGDDAAALLSGMALVAPEHPALAWARSMLRTLTADRTRQAARRGDLSDPWRTSARTPAGNPSVAVDAEWPEDSSPIDGVDAPPPDASLPLVESADVAEAAFSRLGARLRTTTDQDLAREVRLLLRAFSTGGTLSAAVSPEQAHAARSVLAGLLSLVVPPGKTMVEHTPPAVASLLAPLLAPRRSSVTPPRGEDIARLMRRATGTVPVSQHRLVDIMARSVAQADAGARPIDGDERGASSGEFTAVVHGEPESGSPLVPIRMGLALLTESRATRAADFAAWPVAPGDITATPWREPTPTTLGVPALMDAGRERYLSDWTTARVIGEQQRPTPSGGRGAGFVAILCVTAALAAAINGATVVAVALGVGAAWIGLRRSGRPRGD